MEKRVLDIHQKKSNDLIWTLEHEELYTAGTSSKDDEIIDKSINVINKKLISLGLKESVSNKKEEIVKEDKIEPKKPKTKPEQKPSSIKTSEPEQTKTVQVSEKKNKKDKDLLQKQ